ncbi:MAG: WecB/TagA/CpsF family glycosyltransferase [Verrucomicrobiota bacterium]
MNADTPEGSLPSIHPCFPAATAPPVVLMGVPLDNVTTAQAVDLIEQMVASRLPHYLVSAGVDFLVRARRDVELHRILTDAHLVLCRGRALVWASRLLGNPLPRRGSASGLVRTLLQVAARKKYRVFFLGDAPEFSQAESTRQPDLIVAGHYAPPAAPLLEMDHAEICRRVKEARPDILLVALGCPTQEKWMAMHYRSLDVPVTVAVGARRDSPGRRSRLRNAAVFSRAMVQQWWRMQSGRGKPASRRLVASPDRPRRDWKRIMMPARLDGAAARRDNDCCEDALAGCRYGLLDLSAVAFIDSTGVGWLVRLQKRARLSGRAIILLAPSLAVRSALRWMRLEGFFNLAPDLAAARKLMEEGRLHRPVVPQPNYFPSQPSVFWRGEITAANVEHVWRSTQNQIALRARAGGQFLIDISALKFIDSAGAWLMLRAKELGLEQGLEIVFTGAQPRVRNVLRFARVESVLARGGGWLAGPL